MRENKPIRSSLSSRFSLRLMACILIFFLLTSIPENNSWRSVISFALYLSFLGLCGYCEWSYYVRSKRVVHIDTSTECVVVTTYSMMLHPRHKRYALSDYSAVISYVCAPIGKMLSTNRVELTGNHGTKPLLLAEYLPRFPPITVFTWLEAEEGKMLREELATSLGLKDSGFIGMRRKILEDN